MRVTGSEKFDEAVAGKFSFGMLALERIAVTCVYITFLFLYDSFNVSGARSDPSMEGVIWESIF